jgi:hypothetical protein
VIEPTWAIRAVVEIEKRLAFRGRNIRAGYARGQYQRQGDTGGETVHASGPANSRCRFREGTAGTLGIAHGHPSNDLAGEVATLSASCLA